MMAAFGGHLDLVSSLMDSGASTSATNKKGKTAAFLATQAGHADIAKTLGTSLRSKKKSSRRHSDPSSGDLLTVSTSGLSRSKSPKVKSPAVEAPVDADAELSSSPGGTRGKKEKKRKGGSNSNAGNEADVADIADLPEGSSKDKQAPADGATDTS